MLQIFEKRSWLRPNPGNILPMLGQSLALLLLAGAMATAVNLWRPAGLSFHYQGDQELRSNEAQAEGEWIDVEAAETLFALKKAVFIDARPPSLFEQEHISGAMNLPLESLESSFEKMNHKIPMETMIIVYCDGRASERSSALAKALLLRGRRNVKVLEKGWDMWVAQELPIEAGDHS